MSKYNGYDGSFSVDGNAVAELEEWSIDAKGVETTGLAKGEAVQQTAVSAAQYTANVSGFLDPSDTNGQIALAVGATVTSLIFYPDGTGSGDYTLSVSTAVVTSVNKSSPMGYGKFSVTLALNAAPVQAVVA